MDKCNDDLFGDPSESWWIQHRAPCTAKSTCASRASGNGLNCPRSSYVMPSHCDGCVAGTRVVTSLTSVVSATLVRCFQSNSIAPTFSSRTLVVSPNTDSHFLLSGVLFVPDQLLQTAVRALSQKVIAQPPSNPHLDLAKFTTYTVGLGFVHNPF